MKDSETFTDPLVGDELIRISLETYEIHLIFQHSTVQIGAPFIVRDQNAAVLTFNPENHQGDLSVLWSLVGQTIHQVRWQKSITLEFDGRIELEVPEQDGRARGAVLGTAGNNMTYEEF